MPDSLFFPIVDTNIKYQEYDNYTHIITEISSDDFNEDIMITLNFPLGNINLTIKINKYCSINNIAIFIQNKLDFSNITMIFNDSIIKYGSFESLNIKNNSIIKIMNTIQTGRSLQSYSNSEYLFCLIKNKSSNTKTNMTKKEIDDNINKYGYWGAFTELQKTPKKKIYKNHYKSPEYNQKRENIDHSEFENIGKKYHIAMQELYEREKKEKMEKDKMSSKIASLREKIKKSNDKKNKIVVQEKKDTM
jgi:hypothetical protein